VYSDSGFTAQPLFKTEVWNSSFGKLASIQTLVIKLNQRYGIYQTHEQGTTGLLNYFQDPVKMGNVSIGNGSYNTGVISLDPNVTSLDFKFNPGNPPIDPVTPFSINVLGVRVKSNLITDNFKMISGAGSNKVLTSDASGNASWTNPPSGVIAPWSILNNNIISNLDCRYVGIGTEKPTQILDIYHSDPKGGIAIDQLLNDSTTGSGILFKKNSVPQFAMGHGYVENRSSFFLWSHMDGDGKTELYMDLSNGMTGIGTEWPRAKLEVAGDFKATSIGIGTDPPVSDSRYRLFVEGGIKARSVKVTISAFADYVFDKNYLLLSIPELETFVNTNHRLPGMPSSEQVCENEGVEIGEMQVKLLEKIEEQSRYIISLQHQIDEIKSLMPSVREEKR
jgi:hypothetical protein